MECDCRDCEKLTWAEWLDEEPGPLATVAIILLILFCVAVW